MARGDIDAERRHKAIEALARDPNVSAAARASGYDRNYLQRLKRDTDFQAKVAARRAELAAAVTTDAERDAIVLECVDRLRKVVKAGTDKDAIAAAKALLARLDAPKAKASPAAPVPEPKAGKQITIDPEEIRKRFG